MTPPSLSFWYWHAPFKLTAEESATLQKIGVRELFVRSSALTYSGKEKAPVRVSLPQVWKTPTLLPIHLVFPVDSTLVRRLEEIPEERLASGMTAAIVAEWERATKAGMTVACAQIDLDCPTRLLPRYARLLKQVKSGIGKPLSITLLTSWYASRDLADVLDSVDFSVPQFYEAQTFPTRAQFRPISDLARLKRGLKAAERMGKPFYVGLPIYGHAPVYDGQGRLRGLFHDASAAELINRPEEFSLRSISPLTAKGQMAKTAAESIGEELIEFGPVVSKNLRGDEDFRLCFDLPTPNLLAQHWKALRDAQPAHLRGAILYRFPEPQETTTLPLVSVAAVVRGETPVPELSAQLRSRRAAPYELIEQDKTDLSLSVYVDVTNIGNAPTRIAPDAVKIELHFTGSHLNAIRPGQFDRVEAFIGKPSIRSGIARADGVCGYLATLAPGEKRTLGPLVITPQTGGSITGSWTVTLPEGVENRSGTIPAMRL